MNYYRRYSGDYLRDTSRLSMVEHGAYSLMLDYYYSDETPLPLDRDELYLMLRAMKPGDRAAVDKVLTVYFTKQADGWHQKRCDPEISVSAKARSNGKIGGRPPGKSETGLVTGMETGLVTGFITEDETGDGCEEETGGETETLTGSGHPPTTNLQPPTTTPQPPPSNPQPPKSKSRAAAPLPGWIPADAWLAWMEVRKKLKAPNTEAAIDLAVASLAKLRDEGHDPKTVLERSTMRGWKGLFPVKDEGGGLVVSEASAMSAAGQRTANALQDFVARGGPNA